MILKIVTVVLGLFFLATSIMSKVIYLNPASATEDGTSWSSGYHTLKSSIDNSISGDEIWVTGDSISISSTLNDTINFTDDIKIFGGFSGVETSKNQRDIKNNPTIFIGEKGISTDSTDNQKITLVSKDSSSLTIDGVTFKEFISTNIDCGTLTLKNTTIKEQYSTSFFKSTTLSIDSCRFSDNVKNSNTFLAVYPKDTTNNYTIRGTLFENTLGSALISNKKVTLINCSVIKTGLIPSSGIAYSVAVSRVDSCFFSKNSRSLSCSNVSNTTFQENRVQYGSAIALTEDGRGLYVKNCKMIHNTSRFGGDFYISTNDDSTVQYIIENTIFSNDSTAYNHAAIITLNNSHGVKVTFRNCLFDTPIVGGTSVKSKNYLFTAYMYKNSSIEITNSIFNGIVAGKTSIFDDASAPKCVVKNSLFTTDLDDDFLLKNGNRVGRVNFVNPKLYDFRVLGSSASIDAADTSCSSAIDYYGNTPSDDVTIANKPSTKDIGPFEYIGSSLPKPIVTYIPKEVWEDDTLFLNKSDFNVTGVASWKFGAFASTGYKSFSKTINDTSFFVLFPQNYDSLATVKFSIVSNGTTFEDSLKLFVKNVNDFSSFSATSPIVLNKKLATTIDSKFFTFVDNDYSVQNRALTFSMLVENGAGYSYRSGGVTVDDTYNLDSIPINVRIIEKSYKQGTNLQTFLDTSNVITKKFKVNAHSKVVYVAENGNGDGTSFSSAYGSIQQAIDSALAGDTLFIKTGTYQSFEAKNLDKIASVKNRYIYGNVIDKPLHIFGGFSGTETKVSDRTGISEIVVDFSRNNVKDTTVFGFYAMGSELKIDGFSFKATGKSRVPQNYSTAVSLVGIGYGSKLKVANCSFFMDDSYESGLSSKSAIMTSSNLCDSVIVENCQFQNGGILITTKDYDERSALLIKSCRFNRAIVTIQDSSATLVVDNCDFTGKIADNSFQNYNKPVITTYSDSIIVQNSRFKGINNGASLLSSLSYYYYNSTTTNYLSIDSISVDSCTFSYRMFSTGSNHLKTNVNHSKFSDNISSIMNADTIQNSIFIRNSCSNGSMLTLNEGSLIENCVFASNQFGESSYYNFIIFNYAAISNAVNRIVNSTFVNNVGASAVISNEENLEIANSIFYKNRTTSATGKEILGGGKLLLTSCRVDANDSLIGTDLIYDEPLFVDEVGEDYRLNDLSPGIDAADGNYLPTTDINGANRFDDGAVVNSGTGTPNYGDIGAFERVKHSSKALIAAVDTIFIHEKSAQQITASKLGLFILPSEPLNSVSIDLELEQSQKDIWVSADSIVAKNDAYGIFTINATLSANGANTTKKLILVIQRDPDTLYVSSKQNGVYGRDKLDAFATIESATSMSVRGDVIIITTDSYKLFSKNTITKKLTIIGGYDSLFNKTDSAFTTVTTGVTIADSVEIERIIFNSANTYFGVTINNCNGVKFTNCKYINGGTYIYITNAEVDFNNIYFKENGANSNLYDIKINDAVSKVKFEQCTFTNYRSGIISAMYYNKTTKNVEINRCQFINNITYSTALRSFLNVNGCAITNSLFANNRSMLSPVITGEGSVIENCTFVNNSLDSTSTNYSNVSGNLEIRNSIFADGKNDVNKMVRATSITNSLFREGISSELTGTRMNLLFGDPMFTDSTNGDFSLMEGSPAIDASAAILYEHPFDISGEVRVVNISDIGAYEYQAPTSSTLNSRLNSVGVIFYPNPVVDRICISPQYKGYTEIYNAQGNRVIHGAENNFDLSSLESGVYYIIIKKGKRVLVNESFTKE